MKKEGFTLIELLIVVAIFGILAAIVYVAVDPAERLRESRDVQRWAEVNSILNAVLKKTLDDGDWPTVIADMETDTPYVIGTNPTSGACSSCPAAGGGANGDCLNLTGVLTSKYLFNIPMDPKYGNWTDTQYFLVRTSGNLIIVGACQPENETSIVVGR